MMRPDDGWLSFGLHRKFVLCGKVAAKSLLILVFISLALEMFSENVPSLLTQRIMTNKNNEFCRKQNNRKQNGK